MSKGIGRKKNRASKHKQQKCAKLDNYAKTLGLMQNFMVQQGLIDLTMDEDELYEFIQGKKKTMNMNRNDNNTVRHKKRHTSEGGHDAEP